MVSPPIWQTIMAYQSIVSDALEIGRVPSDVFAGQFIAEEYKVLISWTRSYSGPCVIRQRERKVPRRHRHLVERGNGGVSPCLGQGSRRSILSPQPLTESLVHRSYDCLGLNETGQQSRFLFIIGFDAGNDRIVLPRQSRVGIDMVHQSLSRIEPDSAHFGIPQIHPPLKSHSWP